MNDDGKAHGDAGCSVMIPLLVEQGFVLSPHPRLTHEKTGLTSEVSADVMTRVQTVTALVIRCL
jgi:hypothetical protein